MKTKPTPLALSTAMILGAISAQAQAELVITEYIEGSGTNKVIELTNFGSSDIQLSEYTLALHTSGSATPSQSATLSGTVAPGKTAVYFNSGATDDFKKVGEALNNIVNFNGDDAIVLSKGGAEVDRFGRTGEPQKVVWQWTDSSGNELSSQNRTLRRAASVTSGDTDSTEEFPSDIDQWIGFEQNTFNGIGCSGIDECPAAPEGTLIISEYVEGSSNNKAIELTNLSSSAINLDAEQYQLLLYSGKDLNTTPGNNSISLTGTIEAGASIVFYNAGADDKFKNVGEPSTVTYYNGDDALVLVKGAEEVVVDRLGQLGVDPGDTWTDPNNPEFSTGEKTLRRNNDVIAGDTDPYAAFPGDENQWAVFPQDTADGLGCAGEEACGELPDPDPTPDPDVPCSNCENLTPVADPSTFNGDEYYSDVLNGKFATADEMKNALSAIIATGHQPLTYKQVWTVLTYSDEDPSDVKSVIGLYSGKPISKFDNGGNPDDWNREHVWPKSHGFPSESQWGYSDAHHLRPTDVSVNSARDNNDFDNGGSPVDQAPESFVDDARGTFEPRDRVKGDVARMMFYMDTRYQGAENDGGMPDLVLVDSIGTDADAAEAGKLCTLYAWHFQDEVDDTDRLRNDEVYKYQGNRNPFIDRPNLVREVYGAQCGDDPNPPLAVDLEVSGPESVVEGDSFTLSATVADGDDGLTYVWEQVSGDAVEMVGEGAEVSIVAPVVSVDTTLEFKVTVSDGNQSTFEIVAVTIAASELELELGITGTTNVVEGDEVTLTADIGDYAGTDLTYQWVQISGNTVEFTANAESITFATMEVNMDQRLVFELTVSDGINSVSTQAEVVVTNEPQSGWSEKDGGAMGGLISLLLPLLFWRRRQH